MSARAVAGGKSRSGTKASAEHFTRAQAEDFKRGLHDFARRHGARVTPAQILRAKIEMGRAAGTHGLAERLASEPPQRERRQQRPAGWWHERFFAALARVGDIKGAALMVGVSPGVAWNGVSRDSSLRERVSAIERDYLRRQLSQLAKGQLQRLTIWPGKARQLLAMLIPVAP